MHLGERYEIGRLLGRGGMAEVYLAHDKRLNRTVAVKVLRSDLARDEQFQERFRREAQAAAGLNYPAIVGVYDTGEDHRTEATGEEVTIPFIVMEYVEGETLRSYISEEEPMSERRASEIMAGVLGALEYSHKAGIVHRDIKPGNVMITKSGAVKVMDFGIARAVAESTAAMTQTQAVMGTAQYLSPEQARGQQVDARSDVYSAAVVLYELLTGRPPFTGDSPVSIAYQHVRETPLAPSTFNPNISPTMDAVVLKGLTKDRDHRYQSAAEFSRDIAAVAAGREPLALAAGAASDEAATAMLSPSDYPTEVVGDQSTQLIPTHTTTLAPTALSPAATDGPGDELEEEQKDRGKILIWVLAAIALLAVAAAAWWLLFGSDRAPAEVAVPNVVGQTEAEARTILTEAKLEPKFEQAPSTEVEDGKVISTDPAEGTTVAAGSTVTVQVSTGPKAATMPDITGKTREEAEAILAEQGLTLKIEGTEDIDGVARNTIGRTDPTQGATVNEGDTVSAWLSSGRVKVPSLSGLTESAARDELGRVNLGVSVTYRYEEGQTVGTVLEQNPTADTVVDPESTVRIVVAGEPGPVTVPNVTGQSLSNAEQAMSAAGFGITPVEEFSDTVAAGRVIRTDPGANAEAERGATVTIVISKGPENSPSPTPTGETTSPGNNNGG